MKKIILLVLLCISTVGFSQILEPVKWQTSVNKISDTELELISTAKIEPGWHLYSQNVPDGGPIPTTFTYQNPEKAFNLVGTTTEDEGHTVNDPVFQMKIKYFEEIAVFKQTIKLNGDPGAVKGQVEFMVCDDSRCLPPTVIDLFFAIKPREANLNNENEPMATGNNDVVNEQLYGLNPEELSALPNSCDSVQMSPTDANTSLWRIFGLGFLGGLLALLTPCVFPMIPLTVSFFTKKGDKSKGSGTSKALLYGFFIFAVYILLSVPFHVLDSVNPDILNEISTNIWLNIIFFVIFVFFAFSFFGY